MENEIELKIMLLAENITPICQWINQQNVLNQATEILGNTYYDTASQFFAKQQMGLRVRNKNQQYEMTLKTKGEIIGGLHIRPEYNLKLSDSYPDLKKLTAEFNLPFEQTEQLQAELNAVFSTDFTRDKWLVKSGRSLIEIALDRGLIKNHYGEEAICELELELKQGEIGDILVLLTTLPKLNGIWFSGLSKAQRGYLIGNTAEIAKIVNNLPGCQGSTEKDQFQLAQQVADFIRITEYSAELLTLFLKLTPQITESELNLATWQKIKLWLSSQDCFAYNVRQFQHYFSKQ